MKNNIDEANIAGSRKRPRGNDREQPGEGSRLPPNRALPPQPESSLPINRRLAKMAGTEKSRQSRTGPQTTYRTDVSRQQPKASPKGAVTYYSVTPTPEQKPQSQTQPKPQLTQKEKETILTSLSARRKRSLGMPTNGPVNLTSKGKTLKPGGRAEQERIRDAKRAGSEVRLARAHRKKIIKEFIEKYRKSILK